GDAASVLQRDAEQEDSGSARRRQARGERAAATPATPCEPTARTTGTTLLDTACWTARSGNSHPPATLPTYIGVLVSTSVVRTSHSDDERAPGSQPGRSTLPGATGSSATLGATATIGTVGVSVL
ncbi:MAG: hypothetical protein M3O15_09685, partial [Acidobacteriota bacterium]|nr:hypothetical protein [Acidobacteriota bacterium]